MRVDEAISNFEIYLLSERRVAQNTVKSYLSDLNQFETYLNKKKVINISQIDTDFLRGYLKFLRGKLHAGANSLSRKVSTLKSFFNYLSQRHNLNNTALMLVFPKLQKRLPRFLSETEIEKLLEHAAKDETTLGIRNRVMLMLLYVTGMRISELTTLKLHAIDFKEGLITVQGKGDKQRIVPVMHELLDLIQNIYLKKNYPQLIGKHHSEYLFPSINNDRVQAISRQTFWLVLKKMAISAGVSQKLSPHLLRHSLATHLLKKGANLRLLQILLGHERLATVQIYTHVDISYLRTIYDDKHNRS